MTHYFRNQSVKLKSLINKFPVVAILGARQVGKSTLANACFPDWRYVDLERPDDFARLKDDPLLFFQQYPQDVIIDEAQILPELFPVLRGIIDQKREQNGRFILTGSSSPELLTHLSESLAGRIAIIELGTLKANELAGTELSPFYKIFEHKLDKEYLPKDTPPIDQATIQKIWFKGGYPQPLQFDDVTYRQWMEQYQNTYINRDIAALFPKLNKFAYQRFLTLLSQLSGTILNRSDIARTLAVNEKTIREYLQIIDGTFVWRQLPSFAHNTVKSLVKMPKGHMRDSGLCHFLLKLESFDDLFVSPALGHSFESFVIEELIKGLQATMQAGWQSYYYRTRRGLEVDFILEGGFGILPIEIKHNSHTTPKQLKPLAQFIAENNLAYGIVINQSTRVEWLTSHIIQIPVGWI